MSPRAQSRGLFYTGEQFDTNAQQYYLRARYYNPLNGRFNRVDPYSGNTQDPQSLHKYLYCHANPVNGIDPSGQMTLIGCIITISVIAVLFTIGTFWFTSKDDKIRNIEVYFPPDPSRNNHLRGLIFEKQNEIEAQWNTIVRTQLFDNNIPNGTKEGYDSKSETYRIIIHWAVSQSAVGYTLEHDIWLCNGTYKWYIGVLSDVPIDGTAYTAANVLMHEMVHSVYDHGSWMRSREEHESTGLMARKPEINNEGLYPFSGLTQKRLRIAIGQSF